MYDKVLSCCVKPTDWIFVYENDIVYSICKEHFYSNAHRNQVKDVINFQTRIRYKPNTIFGDYPCRKVQCEVLSNV